MPKSNKPQTVQTNGTTNDSEVVDVLQHLVHATADVAYALTRSYDINRSREDDRPLDSEVPRFGGVVSEALCLIANAINRQTETQDGLHRIAEGAQAIAQAINNLAGVLQNRSLGRTE